MSTSHKRNKRNLTHKDSTKKVSHSCEQAHMFHIIWKKAILQKRNMMVGFLYPEGCQLLGVTHLLLLGNIISTTAVFFNRLKCRSCIRKGFISCLSWTKQRKEFNRGGTLAKNHAIM